MFVLASATIADPAGCARLLTGLDIAAVTEDGSPRAPVTFALWEPPLLHSTRQQATRAPQPRTCGGRRPAHRAGQGGGAALAFVRSRRGAETVALARCAAARSWPTRVAAYRSGYLPDDRRDLEAGLRDGRIIGHGRHQRP